LDKACAGPRQKEWEKKLEITRQEVKNVLRNPEQVVPGDRNVMIAQTRRGKGLLRVALIDELVKSPESCHCERSEN